MKSGKTFPYFFIILILSSILLSTKNEVKAQAIIRVAGTVASDSAVLAGASIYLKANPKIAVKSDEKGHYEVKVPANGTLVFSYIGFKNIEIKIEGNDRIDAKLERITSDLEEIAVVAYGTQKKISMVSSITTISAKDLKGPSSNLTTMLAGRIAGIISFQRSGEPGSDNAQFFIRGIGTFGAGKVDPLILIDGMESTTTDLARLQPDDIAGFSVLKDATACALYGARGANGVILVATKTGGVSKTKFNFRYETSVSSNTRNFKFSDNVTYMTLANEAALTRDPLAALPYSQTKIDHTAKGDNELLYPSNNWLKQMIKDYTINPRMNLNISGGNQKAQYYVAGTYNIDNGVLKSNTLNNFNSNIKLQSYSVRSNITLNFTNTTTAIIRTSGQFDDYHGPIGGGSNIFNQVIWSNPVMFPAVYPSDLLPNIKHPLFGNAIIPGTTSLYNNPYANAVSGYQTSNTSTLVAQIEIKQDFKFITSGLTGRMMAYTNRYAYFDVSRSYNPFFYTANTLDNETIESLTCLNDGGTSSVGTVGTEYLNYSEGTKTVNTTNYMEAAVNYNKQFGPHAITAMLIYTLQEYKTGNAGSLEASLPHRNEGVSGRITYDFDRRYLMEFNFGYNGSERFAAKHRFGFFPSIGLGYVISNEKYFEKLLSYISNLKIRMTYGLVGNDQIGSSTDRFFYLSNVNMNNSGYGANFGTNYAYWRNGISISRYENNNITWEKSNQLNIGIDASFLNGFEMTVDAYHYERSNILMTRAYVPSTMGLEAGIQANVGKASSEGVDIQLTYSKTFQKGWWTTIRANMTYAKNKLKVNEEPNYDNAHRYLSAVGKPLNQTYGLIAERLFVDDQEVQNSPSQSYGDYLGGDIKYRDVDKNGVIDDQDKVAIGYPTTPELIYGFGFSLGYKSFDISAFFQGSARSSFFINPANISPFVLNGGHQNELLKVISDNHWSEQNRNLYAFWPRLSDQFINNNNQTSTWWMRNGSFLRLKQVEIGCTLKPEALRILHIDNLRLYVNASNLFILSNFKMWDVEMGGNGLGYPIQRVFNMGINLSF